MQTVKLVTRVNTGMFASRQYGLIADGVRSWLGATNSPDVIAHDLLEHVNGLSAIGTVHDELMALGAVTVVRSNTYPVGVMARETGRQILICTRLGSRNGRPAKLLPVSDAEREPPSLYNDSLLVAMAYTAPDFVTHDTAFVSKCAADALHYLRRGQRLALERFGSPDAARMQFDAIIEAVRPYAKNPRKGDEFQLEYGDERATCKLIQRTEMPTPAHDPGFYFNGDMYASMAKLNEAARVWKKTGAMSGGAQPQNIARDTLAAEAKATKAYVARVYGPKHAQRNVYKEARA